jgi:hypothetical protein
MPAKKILSILALTAAFLSLGKTAYAQIATNGQGHDKVLTCIISNDYLGIADSCGLDGGFEYIFVGSILSVNKINASPDSEYRLRLKPEEIFLGSPAGVLITSTSQETCFPEFKPGDRWLIFLRREENSRELIMFGSDLSKPETDAKDEIALLRSLVRMKDTGIVKGWVGHLKRDKTYHDTPGYTAIPDANHKIIAKRWDTGAQYTAISNKEGNFEFEPLPVGSYDLTANTTEGLWADEGGIDILPRSCHLAHFELVPDGRIAGRVTDVYGKSVKYLEVGMILMPDAREFHSTSSGEDGYYEIDGIPPGRYLVGIGIESVQGNVNSFKIYYPGVSDKSKALVIKLGKAEKRTHIDFIVPSTFTP